MGEFFVLKELDLLFFCTFFNVVFFANIKGGRRKCVQDIINDKKYSNFNTKQKKSNCYSPYLKVITVIM